MYCPPSFPICVPGDQTCARSQPAVRMDGRGHMDLHLAETDSHPSAAIFVCRLQLEGHREKLKVEVARLMERSCPYRPSTFRGPPR